jgi:XTP/dITP diphosphohydrolase
VTPALPRLLVATFNPGKRRELVRLLAPLGVEVLSLADLGLREAYEETGATYEDNARGKALHYAALAGLPALADDSGLEVDALGGRPGPLSARYGGPDLDDVGRNELLLKELTGVPGERRTARYVAVAALAHPRDDDSAVRLFRATCEGRIATAPRGSRGFGYDPIFFYPPFAATFGEVDDTQKDRVSHRGLALAQVAQFLRSAEGKAYLEAPSGRPTATR